MIRFRGSNMAGHKRSETVELMNVTLRNICHGNSDGVAICNVGSLGKSLVLHLTVKSF